MFFSLPSAPAWALCLSSRVVTLNPQPCPEYQSWLLWVWVGLPSVVFGGLGISRFASSS